MIQTYNGWAQANPTARVEVAVHHLSEPSTENDRKPIPGAPLEEMIDGMREEKT
jgi:hypothetical protein